MEGLPTYPEAASLCTYKARGQRAWGHPPPSPRVAEATFSGRVRKAGGKTDTGAPPTHLPAASFSPRRPGGAVSPPELLLQKLLR